MSAPQTVAIVGGGVAGAVTAIHLARSAAAPDVVLVDRTGTFARGVAYSTSSATHLLNVPAARMSVLADDAGHFQRWAERRLGAAVAPDAFLPRGLFGDYVADTLAAAAGRGIRLVCGTAIDVEPGLSSPTIRCEDGTRIAADHVVIALGNGAPAEPPVGEGAAFYASTRYTPNPWSPGALRAIAADADVLLVGSGLTMYDVALALRERGHTGALHAVSRRGLRPRPHAPGPLAIRPGPAPEHWLTVAPTVSALLRAVRTACAETEDWRAVMDSLRVVSARLWQRLDVRERGRFLARLRPYWDVHRHRAPLAVHRRIEALVTTGALRSHVGRIRAWREAADGVTAVCDGGAIRVAHVVNCTGPDTDVRRSPDPLVQALLARGLIVRDRFGLGVETSADGALVDALGHASSVLSTLGTWRRAECWESVAVPELRMQAAALAQRLLGAPVVPAHRRSPLRRALARAPASPGKRRPGKRHPRTGTVPTVPVGCEGGDASTAAQEVHAADDGR